MASPFHLSPFLTCSSSSVIPLSTLTQHFRPSSIQFTCRFGKKWKIIARTSASHNGPRISIDSHSMVSSKKHELDFLHQKKRIGILVTTFLVFANISLPLPSIVPANWSIESANAVLFSPNSRLPRTGEIALRRAIPANSSMKNLQGLLEEISYLLRIPQRKPYGTMEANVKKALKIAEDEKDTILGIIPPDLNRKGYDLYNTLVDGKGILQSLLQCIKDQDPDKISLSVASSLDKVAELELLQAPGLSYLLPQQYSEYPRLTGRAVVEFTISKAEGNLFSPKNGEEPAKDEKIQVVVDGFSAPLTAGNFVKLVLEGAYDGTKLNFSNQAIISESTQNQIGNDLPLEIMPAGQFEPLYRTALSVQDGELPVLPLSVYGAVAMTHSQDSDDFSSPSQFFFYLYDKKNSGLGGICFEEGQFSVFGYATKGYEFLSQIGNGDVIKSAKIIEGSERLVIPNQQV